MESPPKEIDNIINKNESDEEKEENDDNIIKNELINQNNNNKNSRRKTNLSNKNINPSNNISDNTEINRPKIHSMKKKNSKENKEKKETKIEEDEIYEYNDNIIIQEKEPFQQTNSFVFKTITRVKRAQNGMKLLDEQWNYEKILLDYNIIDFTCKNNKIYYFNFIKNIIIYSNC